MLKQEKGELVFISNRVLMNIFKGSSYRASLHIVHFGISCNN